MPGDRDPLVTAAGEEIMTGRRTSLKYCCGLFPVSFFFRGTKVIAVSRPEHTDVTRLQCGQIW